MTEAVVRRDVAVPLLLTLTFLHANHIVHRCANEGDGRGGLYCTYPGTLLNAKGLQQAGLPLGVTKASRRSRPSARVLPILPPVSPVPARSDIKPENIMFAADGGLRLGDFGLSIDARLERPTSRVGTLDYM